MAEIENLQIVGGAIYTVGNQDIIADDWEAGKAYIKDRSYAIKDHKLYQCAVSHTSVEPFDPTKWTEKTVAEALGTAGSANMIECTLAEYTAWKAGGQLINETVYVITDAPNLNATAQDISYDGGADTVWDKVEGKQNTVKVASGSGTTSANGNIGVTQANKFVIIGAWCNVVNACVIPFIDYSSASDEGSSAWYLHFMNGNASQTSINSTNVTYYYAYVEIQ